MSKPSTSPTTWRSQTPKTPIPGSTDTRRVGDAHLPPGAGTPAAQPCPGAHLTHSLRSLPGLKITVTFPELPPTRWGPALSPPWPVGSQLGWVTQAACSRPALTVRAEPPLHDKQQAPGSCKSQAGARSHSGGVFLPRSSPKTPSYPSISLWMARSRWVPAQRLGEVPPGAGGATKPLQAGDTQDPEVPKNQVWEEGDAVQHPDGAGRRQAVETRRLSRAARRLAHGHGRGSASSA